MSKSIYMKRSLALVLAGILLAAIPGQAFAMAAPAAVSMSGIVCNAVGFVTGPTGAAIATVAILILGIAAFFGKVTWGLAVLVAIGMAGLFGAASIANIVSGQTACGVSA
jgi:type IV secretory pathway VirB2 component (pilin)